MRPVGWMARPDWREVTSICGPTWQLIEHVIVGSRDGLSPPLRSLEKPKDVRDSRASLSAQPPADSGGIDAELACRRPPPVLSIERPSDSDEVPRCGAQVGDVTYRPCWLGAAPAHPLLAGRELLCHRAAAGRAQSAAAADDASARRVGLEGGEFRLAEDRD
jgi:hypothetical protein